MNKPNRDEVEVTIASGGEELGIYEIMQRFRNDGSCEHIIIDALTRYAACATPPTPEDDPLVDCPRCHGLGFRPNAEDKLCLCLVEQSQGWSPGKLPKSIAEKLLPLDPPAPVSTTPVRCYICGHYGNVVNGVCREVGTVPAQGGEAATRCDCRCEFPASPLTVPAECICHKEGNYFCRLCDSYHHDGCGVHANYHALPTAQAEAEVPPTPVDDEKLQEIRERLEK